MHEIDPDSANWYFNPYPGNRRTGSILVNGAWIHLVQDTSMQEGIDPSAILRAMGMVADERTLDYYFPENKRGERCPTLELMEQSKHLNPCNPINQSAVTHQKERAEV